MDLSSRQTARATRVFVRAEQEAARSGDTRLGTAHLLLALARDERDHGGGLLDGLDLDRARAWLAACGVGYRDPGHRPWRPGAVFALATALRLADEAAEPTVDVRHLLLGVLADDAEDAPRLLRALGLDVEPLVAGARSDLAQPGTAAIAARTWAASR
jgi:ATP-dependent Clp protease ATP-binding subunit ClpA